MADILLVDTNPDHVRALTGLVKYRTSSSIRVTNDCVDAVRTVFTDPPDLIMINAIMFCSADFGFARALSESPEASSIPLIVHVSGRLETLTVKRIRACGVKKIVQLPVSGSELESEIAEALDAPRPVSRDEVHTVDWGSQAKRVKARPAAKQEAEPKQGVRSVNWAFDGSGREAAPLPKRKPQSVPKREPNREGGVGFKSLSDSAPRVVGEKKQAFRPARVTNLPEVDPRDVKN